MRIAWATPDDAAALVPLLCALHVHEVAGARVPEPDAALSHAQLLTDPATPHRLAIAWDQQGVAIALAAVGRFVSVSDLRPEKALQFELKELFVLPEARRKKIGGKLLAWVVNQAEAEGVCRIDWHVKRHNQRGIEFYQRLGAHIVEDRLSMRKWIRK